MLNISFASGTSTLEQAPAQLNDSIYSQIISFALSELCKTIIIPLLLTSNTVYVKPFIHKVVLYLRLQ